MFCFWQKCLVSTACFSIFIFLFPFYTEPHNLPKLCLYITQRHNKKWLEPHKTGKICYFFSLAPIKINFKNPIMTAAHKMYKRRESSVFTIKYSFVLLYITFRARCLESVWMCANFWFGCWTYIWSNIFCKWQYSRRLNRDAVSITRKRIPAKTQYWWLWVFTADKNSHLKLKEGVWRVLFHI